MVGDGGMLCHYLYEGTAIAAYVYSLVLLQGKP
jgi:hypothetical protein